MRVNFLVNPVFDGWEPTDTRLGGTERGVVEWADALSKRGHSIHVYRNHRNGDGGFMYSIRKEPGAMYHPREEYGEPGIYWSPGVCINIKSPEVPPIEPTIFYTNDVDADKQDLSPYDAVIHISNWAKDNIPVNNPNVFVVPHGYDPAKYYPDKKIPKQCLYASSPDRGLDTLLEAWPKVVEQHPDATLLVTYGVSGIDLPGVICLGDVDEDTMNEIYRTSDIWCHPANGGELQCITGLKAQAAGCWPVIIPAMALSETVRYGTFSTEDTYADDLIEALSFHPPTGRMPKPEPTIRASTDKLLEVIYSVLK